MNQTRTIPRYAHADGHTDLCYSEDGRFVVFDLFIRLNVSIDVLNHFSIATLLLVEVKEMFVFGKDSTTMTRKLFVLVK